jgi:hypothetical protein
VTESVVIEATNLPLLVHGKRTVFGSYISHRLGKIQPLFPAFHRYGWPNSVKLSYITDIFSFLLSFGIQFSHTEDGGNAFHRNVGTSSQQTAQKPKKKRLPHDQQMQQKPEK